MKKETELASKVVDWLNDQGWEVWQEVRFHTYCAIHDIIAIKDNITWCIECKLSFNLKVIEQAYRSNTIFKSIAVPTTNSFGQMICNRLGIGILVVGKNTDSVYNRSGKIFRENYRYSKDIVKKLKDIPKSFARAGSKGGYWTPYKETIRSIRAYILTHEGCTLKEIMHELKHHYASDATARICIRKSLEEYEIDWCKVVKDGKVFRYYIKKEN